MLSYTVLSRVSLILAGKIAAALSSFAMVVILTRELSLPDFGSYVFIMGVSTLVSMISNWGTNELLFRTCSTDLSNVSSLLRVTRLWKLLLALCLGAAFLSYLMLNGASSSELVAAVFLLAASTIDAQSMSHIMLCRAVGDNRTEALFFSVRALVKLLCVAAVAHSGGRLSDIALAICMVNLGGILVLWHHFSKSEILKGQAKPAVPASFRSLVTAATPYALFSVVGAIYAQNGAILAGMLAGKEAAGIYGVGLQFYQVAVFLPVALNIAIQPALSRQFEADRGGWADKVTSLYKRLSLASIAIGGGLYFLLPIILQWSFDERYASAATVVRILMLAFVFRFLSSALIGSSMISAKKLPLYNRAFVVSLIANLAFNIMLIPRFGAAGGAISLLISEFLLVVVGSTLLRSGLRNF